MTKKDYVRIAQVFHVTRCYVDVPGRVTGKPTCQETDAATWEALAYEMADMLATDNPRFDRARFLKACGVEG